MSSSAPRENIVFVGGISRKVDEACLRNFFSTFGTVTECKIIIDRNTGKSKGYGFVVFADRQAAESVKKANQEDLFLLGKCMNVGDAYRKRDVPGGSPSTAMPTGRPTVGGPGYPMYFDPQQYVPYYQPYAAYPQPYAAYPQTGGAGTYQQFPPYYAGTQAPGQLQQQQQALQVQQAQAQAQAQARGGWASMPQSRATFVGASTSAPSDSYGGSGSGGSGASEDAHRRATGGSSDMPEDLVAGVARLAVGGQKKSTVGTTAEKTDE